MITQFPLFMSSKPRCQADNLIYRKWSIVARSLFGLFLFSSLGIMKTLAYILLISMCLAKSSADLKLGHSFFSPLDEDQKVKLYWNVSTANKEIYFTVEAQTTGWVGFGISSGQGRMAGADIVIGWVKDGKPYFKVKQTCLRFQLSTIRFMLMSIYTSISSRIREMICARELRQKVLQNSF